MPCRIKSVPPQRGHMLAAILGGLARRLKQSTERQLSFDEMKSVYDILKMQNKSDIISNYEHVQNIKRTQSNV